MGLVCLVAVCVANGEELPDALGIAANFHHTSWTAKDGVPVESTWLAQTTDGWLWLGGETGLARFDGVSFERVTISASEKRSSDTVYSLFAGDSSDLWIGYGHGGISHRLADGSFRHYGRSEGVPAGTVISFAQDARGRMWAASSKLMRFDGERWHEVGSDMTLPDGSVFAATGDQDGTIWVSHESGIFYLLANATHFKRFDRKVPSDGGAFLQRPDGHMWYIDREGIHRLPKESSGKPRAPRATAREWSPALFDQHGDLWTMYPKLIRLRSPVPDEVAFSELTSADSFTARDGLSAGVAVSMIEDREGAIWVATPGGLDRFRRTNVHKVSFDPEVPYHVGIVAADDGAIWAGMFFGQVPGPKDGLWKYDDGELKQEAADTIPGVTGIYRDAAGVIWIGTTQGIWKRSREGTLQKLPQLPDEFRNTRISTLTVNAAGDLWVSSSNQLLYRFRRGLWEPFGNHPDLSRKPVNVHTLAVDGRMWIGYMDGTVAVVNTEHITTYTSREGLARRVTAISAARNVVVAAGEDGIFILNNGRFHRLLVEDQAAMSSVTGMLQARNGDLWLNGLRGAVRIDSRHIEAAIKEGNYAVPIEVFDGADGYPGVAQQLGSIPTIAQGADGRLWFTGTLGAGWLHPERIHRNAVSPSVHVRSVTVDKKVYEAVAPAELPKGTRDLQVNYTALSLARPEQVRFRYRLHGYENSWTDAGNRREAFFTNLPPGDYRFEVMAANENGVWSKTSSSVDILIPALFIQTRTFAAICVVAVLALLWSAYALRVRHLTARERSRLEERLVERERIARELHDTLLQGVQGLMLRFQSVADEIGSDVHARAGVEQALERAEALLVEGRDRVKNLRKATEGPITLSQALLDAAAQMSPEGSPRIHVIQNGDARVLHTIVREEVERIATEALSNAVRHAEATTIEVEFFYDRNCLRMLVRDNGRGMEESIITAGRQEHFGLLGMRERAKRVRARLTISSQPGAGTEVNLIVPASMAFMRKRPWRRSSARSDLPAPKGLS